MAAPRMPFCGSEPGSLLLLSLRDLSFWLRRYSATHSLPGVVVSTRKYPGQYRPASALLLLLSSLHDTHTHTFQQKIR